MGFKSPKRTGSKQSSIDASKRSAVNVQSLSATVSIDKYLIPHVKSEVVKREESKADISCVSAAAVVNVDSSGKNTTVNDPANNSNEQVIGNDDDNSTSDRTKSINNITSTTGSKNNNVGSCRQKENVLSYEATKTQKRSRTSRKNQSSSSTSKSRAATSKPSSTNNVDIKEKFITDYFQPRRSHRRPKTEVLKSKQMIMEEKIRREDESGFDVVKYEEKGRGVISNVDLRAGDFVLEYAGDLIDLKEARQREELYARDSSVGCYMYYFQHDNRNHCIDATRESSRLGRLINHSIKGANLKTRSVTIGGKARLVFLAKRDIRAGEELLYDYGDRSKLSLQSHPWLKN